MFDSENYRTWANEGDNLPPGYRDEGIEMRYSGVSVDISEPRIISEKDREIATKELNDLKRQFEIGAIPLPDYFLRKENLLYIIYSL